MAKGAKVQITVPEGWTSPHLDNGDGISTAGEVKLTGKADLEMDRRRSLETDGNDECCVSKPARSWCLTYKSVKAPAAAGSYDLRNQRHIAFAGAAYARRCGRQAGFQPDGRYRPSAGRLRYDERIQVDHSGSYQRCHGRLSRECG